MNAIQEFSFEAAQRYLQSVVFIDDEIYYSPPGVSLKDVSPQQGMTIFSGNMTPTDDKALEAKGSEDDDGGDPEFHPKQLVESFAGRGIVCALYEPPADFQTHKDSEVFLLCERADVVILDWDLYNDDGDRVLSLLANLVSQSQSTLPHHVRLCAIYTTKPDLFRVNLKVFENLKKGNLQLKLFLTQNSRLGHPELSY